MQCYCNSYTQKIVTFDSLHVRILYEPRVPEMKQKELNDPSVKDGRKELTAATRTRSPVKSRMLHEISTTLSEHQGTQRPQRSRQLDDP